MQRMKLVSVGTPLGTFVVAGAMVACATLPDLERSDCGDGYVERGEDCEPGVSSLGGSKTIHCAGKGETNACRYVVTSENDSCPFGWAKGTDAICRRASGLFQSASTTTTLVGSGAMQAADFNGDGLSDIVADQSVDNVILLGQSNATFSSGQRIPGTLTSPFLRTRDPDGAADVFLPRTFLSAWRGRPGESELRPAIFPFFTLPSNARIVPVLARGFWEGQADAVTVAKDVFLLVEITVAGGAPFVTLFDLPGVDPATNGFAGLFIFPTLKLDDLAIGPDGAPLVRAAELDSTNDCEELVLVRKTGDIEVHAPCQSVGGVRKANNGVGAPFTFGDVPKRADDFSKFLEAKTYPPIAKPNVPGVATGVLIGDIGTASTVTLDGHPDIILAMEETTGGGKEVTLHLSSELNDSGLFGPMTKLSNAISKLPLTVGLATTDPQADFVIADGAVYNTPKGAIVQAASTSAGGEPWTEAAFLSFDVVASPLVADLAALAPGRLDVIRAAGTDGSLFTRQSYPVFGKPTALLVADFDGDLVRDILFRVAETSELFVAYGRRGTFPLPPVSVGRIAVGGSIATGAQRGLLVDGLEDVLVASANGRALSLLLGSPDRALESPFLLPSPLLVAAGETFKQQLVLAGAATRAFTKTDGTAGEDVSLLAMGDRSGPQGTRRRFYLTSVALNADGEIEIGDDGRARTIEGAGFGESVDPSDGDGICTDSLYDHARLVSIDMNRDGRDEIVMTTPAGTCARPRTADIVAQAAIHYASIGGSGSSEAWGAPTITKLPAALPGGWMRLFRADIDGDGFDDVVHVYVTGDNETTVDLYLNRGTLELGAPARMTLVGRATDGAALQLDDKQGNEVVIVTSANLLRAHFENGAWTAPLPVGSSGTFAGLAGANIVTGDFDGDGVADIALRQTKGELSIYRGRPVLQ